MDIGASLCNFSTCPLARGKWISWWASKRFTLLQPDWASCLATKSWACLCFHWQIAFIICTVGGGCGGGGLRTLENPGAGCKKRPWKSRGRGEKDSKNPGCGLIWDQNPGNSLRLKPFSSWLDAALENEVDLNANLSTSQVWKFLRTLIQPK